MFDTLIYTSFVLHFLFGLIVLHYKHRLEIKGAHHFEHKLLSDLERPSFAIFF